MALNSSGPISFGGATVGQSINLELGVSATALASINSTAFRTLAGVPSGAISVSNFYGKSSSVGWVAYLSYMNNQAGGWVGGTSCFVDNAGNFYWMYSPSSGNPIGVAVMNSDATVASYRAPSGSSNGATNILPGSTWYASAGYVPVQMNGGSQLSSNYPVNGLNSSVQVISPSTFKYPTGTYANSAYTNPAVSISAVSSDGSLLVGAKLDVYKVGESFGFIKYNNDFTILRGNARSSLDNINTVPIVAGRTDGTFVILRRANNAQLRWYVINSSGNWPANYRQENTTGAFSDQSGIFCAAADTNNVVYFVTFNTSSGYGPVLYALNTTAGILWGRAVNYPSYQNMNSKNAVTCYGGFIYMANAITNGGVYISCFDSSGNRIWTNSFTLSGTNGTYDMMGGSALRATSAGLFVGWSVGVTDAGGFAMRIPLTGMPSGSSTTITTFTGSRTLSWSISSPSITNNYGTGVTTSSDSGTVWSSSNANSYSATNVNAPIATKTSI
jgi:hypothetical protein